MPSTRRPSAATVLAATALFVSLGGVGWAALDRNSVRSKQIKNGAVRGIDVRNETLTGRDVAESSLGVVPEAARAGEAPPSGGAAGDLTGVYPAPDLAPATVGTAEHASIPAVKVSRTSDFEVPSNAGLGLAVPFDEEEFDTAGMHDPGAESERLTAPVAGVYAVTAQAQWDGGNTGNRTLGIRRNGGLIALDDRTTTVVGPAQHVSAIVRLAEGDWVDMVVEHTGGVPLDVEDIPTRSPALSMVWLAPG